MAWFQSKLAVKENPRLNWDMNRSRGVTRSGWNPLVGLRVSIIDESLSEDKVSVFIEPAAPGTGKLCFMTFTPMIILLPIILPILVSKSTAKAYIFSKNIATGKIDLLYRVKPFRGEEIRVAFEDVTNFGIKFQKDEAFADQFTSCFILTFKDGQVRIPNGECFVLSHMKELNEILEAVNCLIERSLESRQDLNSAIYPLLSTGLADEYAAIPFAASCLLPSESSELADCTTSLTRHSISSYQLSAFLRESMVRVLPNSPTVPCCGNASQADSATDPIQEAIVIPEINVSYRYHRSNDMPHLR
jgi:hypothetical protein